MSWIISKGYLPLTKSETIAHIDEYLDAVSLSLEPSDTEMLNNFVIPGYKNPVIDWYYSGNGVTVDQLSNVFDDLYKQQN